MPAPDTELTWADIQKAIRTATGADLSASNALEASPAVRHDLNAQEGA